MQILIVGAGAIGSVLGGFLADAGHTITLLGRPWHLDAIRREGLRITGIWGDRHLRRLALATRPEEVAPHAPFDWLFVCVKSHQTASAARLLPQWLSAQTLVCAFQNGLGNYEAITTCVAADRVALGRVIFGAELEPGRVRVTVSADDVLIGAPEPRVPLARLQELAEALRASGIPARMTPHIIQALWAKVLYNCALNGLSTLLEVPYGRLLDTEVARQLMRAIVVEAYEVAQAHHLALEPSTAEAYVALLCGRLIPETAAHHSSMLQDLLRGKPTEIDALNGAIVRLARQADLPAPMNALITQLVHAKERFVGVIPVDSSTALN